MSRKERSPAGCAEHRETPSQPDAGSLFCVSSRSHRGHGLIYCPDHHVPCVLLFFHHRPRSAAHPAFQCHSASPQPLDRPTVARSVPVSIGAPISHFDRDAKYGLEVPIAVRSMAIRPIRTSFQSPWQNGVAERWIESCRHDLLDHVIAFNEHHLKRLLSDYVRCYHEGRTYLGLGK
jgi:hypothetical protein